MTRMVSRAARWLVPGTLLLLVGALGAWWYTSYHEVTLRADGETITVRTRVATVGSLLRGEGVVIDAHDRVVPPLEAALSEGAEVRVVRARPVVVDLNGALRTVWTTGETVTDVVRELGLDADVVRPSRSERVDEGTTVVLRTAPEVVVVADGQQTRLLTTAPTVAAVLDDLGLAVDGDDEVSPAPDAAIEPGLTIEVSRLESDVTVEEREIGFDTVRRQDPSRPRGETTVVQEGRPGVERIEYELTIRDGVVADRQVVSRSVVREPRARIVSVGTKSATKQSGQASWYSTASMTCAHRTLPFGTRVTVTNVSNGRSVTCEVADRGPFVAGRVIDLAHDAFAQLADPSVGVISVRLSW